MDYLFLVYLLEISSSFQYYYSNYCWDHSSFLARLPTRKDESNEMGNWVSRERLGVFLEPSYEVETSFTLLDSEDRSSRCHFLFVFLSLHFFFHVFSPMSIYASTNTNTNTASPLLSSAILLCLFLLLFSLSLFLLSTNTIYVNVQSLVPSNFYSDFISNFIFNFIF